jgi:hypothetical protein
MSSDTEQQAQEIEQIAAETFTPEAGQAVREPEAPEPSTAEILKPVLGMGFGILAPNWQVSDSEVEQLSECYGQLVDKYFPKGVGNYGLEINAIMLTGAIVLPRLKMPRKAAPQPETEKDGD